MYRQKSELEIRAFKALSACRFQPASNHKRFARDMALESVQITDKQAAYMWRLVKRYRRQFQERDLVAIACQGNWEILAVQEAEKVNTAVATAPTPEPMALPMALGATTTKGESQ